MRADGLRRLLRFGTVGVLGAAIHMGAFELVYRQTPLGEGWSWLASFLVAASAGWLLNRQFTFGQTRDSANGAEWLRYVAIACLGALAHFLVFAAAIRYVPLFTAMPELAIVPGSIASLCVTYLGSLRFVFPSARNKP